MPPRTNIVADFLVDGEGAKGRAMTHGCTLSDSFCGSAHGSARDMPWHVAVCRGKAHRLPSVTGCATVRLCPRMLPWDLTWHPTASSAVMSAVNLTARPAVGPTTRPTARSSERDLRQDPRQDTWQDPPQDPRQHPRQHPRHAATFAATCCRSLPWVLPRQSFRDIKWSWHGMACRGTTRDMPRKSQIKYMPRVLSCVLYGR